MKRKPQKKLMKAIEKVIKKPQKIVEEPPKKLNRVKYKPPVEVPKDNYLFIITFYNGEKHRVKQLKSKLKPRHFIEQVMKVGSIDKNVFYPPASIKKILWEEVQ